MSTTNNHWIISWLILLLSLQLLKIEAQSTIVNSNLKLLNCNIKGEIPADLTVKLGQITRVRDKAGFLIRKIEEFEHKDPELAFLLAREGEEITRSYRFQRQRAQFLWWQSVICIFLNRDSANYYQSLEWAKMSEELFLRKKDKMGIAKAQTLLAQIHYNRDSMESSVFFQEQAQQTLANLEDTLPGKWKVQGDLYRLKGNIALYSKKFRRTVNEIRSLYDTSEWYYTKLNDNLGRGLLSESRAILTGWGTNPNIDTALAYYQQSLDHLAKTENQLAIDKTSLDIAAYYAKLYRNFREKKWYDTSQVIIKKIIDKPSLEKCKAYYQYGANFQNRTVFYHDRFQRYDSSLLDSALLYYQKGLELAQDEIDYRGLQLIIKGAASICPYLDKKKCQTLFLKVDTVHQKILNKYAAIRNEAEADQVKFQKGLRKIQRIQLLSTYSLVLLSLIIVFGILYARQRWRSVKTTLDMRMKALRARMNPHFISNCLNAIDSLVNQGRNDEASKYLIHFDRLCRQILDNSNQELITLREELETLDNFISLEKLRLEEDLQTFIEIDPQINQDECYVPSLLLQPFVENAIWHGIQKKQAPGTLKVLVKKKDAILECIVEDDGIGRVRARQMEKDSVLNRQSWGLSISKERIDSLQKISGSVFDIIDLYDKDGKAAGTRVFILLPILNKKQPNDQSNHS